MHLALSRVAQVVRDVPASGKGLAVASAQLLIVAESLAMEAALDCFLQVRMWSTVSAIRTRPASLSWTEGEDRSKDQRTFGLQGHLDYRRLDYHRLDYFGLQGRLDYKDIWTTAVWTTQTNRLKVFRPLGLTEISD